MTADEVQRFVAIGGRPSFFFKIWPLQPVIVGVQALVGVTGSLFLL
jgi:hypothetical protein